MYRKALIIALLLALLCQVSISNAAGSDAAREGSDEQQPEGNLEVILQDTGVASFAEQGGYFECLNRCIRETGNPTIVMMVCSFVDPFSGLCKTWTAVQVAFCVIECDGSSGSGPWEPCEQGCHNNTEPVALSSQDTNHCLRDLITNYLVMGGNVAKKLIQAGGLNSSVLSFIEDK